MRPGDVDWDGSSAPRRPLVPLRRHLRALWPGTAELAREAMAAARSHGTIVSYDLNYRPSLWKATGGPEAAAR